MRSKRLVLTNFSRAIHAESACFRPENEQQLQKISQQLHQERILARGSGLSYSDCCLNKNHSVINMQRLQHLIDFDPIQGLLTCQSGLRFADLFTVHPEFIPPIIPGTLHASIGGGIANDIHGKNNAHFGSFGQHIDWLELQWGDETVRCSRVEKADLFHATIGGLGLTGIIKRVGLRLQRQSSIVEVKRYAFSTLDTLWEKMQENALLHDYQVAWLDLMNKPRAIYRVANHINPQNLPEKKPFSLPYVPIRLMSHYGMQLFNNGYYRVNKDASMIQKLQEFNNPLDRIHNWNRFYGKRGLLQFQAVFDAANSASIMQKIISIIRLHQASPTLAVLKYFTNHGIGMMSFVQPGFTLAIDFIHNQAGIEAIRALNACITHCGGKIYLAKDLFLNVEQFQSQYDKHTEFYSFLSKLPVSMGSDLAKRLGLI